MTLDSQTPDALRQLPPDQPKKEKGEDSILPFAFFAACTTYSLRFDPLPFGHYLALAEFDGPAAIEPNLVLPGVGGE
jgi:hypothetical protein